MLCADEASPSPYHLLTPNRPPLAAITSAEDVMHQANLLTFRR